MILFAFVLGWVTYTLSLFDIGRFSITLLLLASCALSVSRFQLTPPLLLVCFLLVLSTSIAWCTSLFKYPGSDRTFTHLFQALLALGVTIGAASVNWDREWLRFRKSFAWLAILVLAYGCYQIVARKYNLPLAFLPMTNLQLGSDDGMQRGYNLAFGSVGEFTRVSSFLAEPSDLGRFMLWAFAIGLSCPRGALRGVLLSVGTAGIVLSQSMGGFVGFAFLISAFMILKRDVRGLLVTSALFIIALTTFSYIWPEETRALMERAGYIASEGRGYLETTGRFRYISDHWEVFQSHPMIGHGIASFRAVTEPESIIFNAVMLLLIERGIVGSLLFLGAFLWVFTRLYHSSTLQDEISQAALFVLTVEIYCFMTFAMIYFPPIYLALGFGVSRLYCASKVTRPRVRAVAMRHADLTSVDGSIPSCDDQAVLISLEKNV